jgi:hypothetical protein
MRANPAVAAIMVSVAVSVGAQDSQITIPSGFLVTDSQGAEVGLVTDLSPTFIRVALVVDGIIVVGGVQSTDLVPLGYTVEFATPDCTGTAYLSLQGFMWEDTGGVMAGPAWTVFRFIGPPPDPPVLLQSSVDVLGCHQYSKFPSTNQRPAVRVVDLRSLFVPPFKIEAFSIDQAHCVRRRLPRAT